MPVTHGTLCLNDAQDRVRVLRCRRRSSCGCYRLEGRNGAAEWLLGRTTTKSSGSAWLPRYFSEVDRDRAGRNLQPDAGEWLDSGLTVSAAGHSRSYPALRGSSGSSAFAVLDETSMRHGCLRGTQLQPRAL